MLEGLHEYTYRLVDLTIQLLTVMPYLDVIICLDKTYRHTDLLI